MIQCGYPWPASAIAQAVRANYTAIPPAAAAAATTAKTKEAV